MDVTQVLTELSGEESAFLYAVDGPSGSASIQS